MSDDLPADELEYAMVMPFVTCTSVGGPHDDTAYVAGYEMGQLDQELGMCDHLRVATPIVYRLIHAANRAQADLIAMKHEYIAEFEEVEDVPEWIAMAIRRPTEGVNDG